MLAMVSGLTPQAQDPQAVVSAVATAMGSAKVTAVQYSGSGTIATFGQNWKNEVPWPEFNLTSYTATIDYSIPAMRIESARDNPDEGKPMQGGGFPLPGVQRANQAVNGKVAWNVAGQNATPALATATERMLEIWSTPHGVVKAAQAAGGKVTVEEQKTARGEATGVKILTFPVGDTNFKANISKENLVTRVEYTIDTPMIGDTQVVALFSQYSDRGDGVQFPGRIVRTEGASPTIKMEGYPVLALTVAKFALVPKPALDVPEAVQKAAAAPAAPVAVNTQKIAEGVVFLTSEGPNSVAIEFADHIVLIEAPLNDAVTSARFDAARKAFGNKPVKYVVNTHHHFDHAGGMRAAVAEDATIVTNGWNRLYFEKILAAPHTLNPDKLSKTPKKATMEFVGTDFGQGREVHEMTDGKRKLQIYRVAGSQHADAMLIAYLPAEKILIEADMYIPAAEGAASALATTSGSRIIINPEPRILYNNIKRQNLQVETIAPLHGRVVKLADMLKELGEAGN
jgi:glyoxylase-like metal-dependent hydrolase (beta-lactamase superfamily II)